MRLAFNVRNRAHIVNALYGLSTIGKSIRGMFVEGVIQWGLHRLLFMCVVMLWGVGAHGTTRRLVHRKTTVFSMIAALLLVCSGVGLTSKSWPQSTPSVCMAVPIITTIPIWDDYCGESYSVGSDLYHFCVAGQGEAHTRTHTVIRVSGVTVACFVPPVQWDVAENGFCAGTLSGAIWPTDNSVEQRNCASGLTCESGQSCSPHDGNNCYRCLPDADGDGIDDDVDTDDDNDGTPDSQDDFPRDATEDTDTDGDGTGDNADTDDDGDGVDDADDACPMGASSGTDTDGDGCTDAEDDDDDGDGVRDLDDLCREKAGPAANHGCPYECGLDEAGSGQEPCTPCGAGEVPNVDGTACVVCEHGESSTLGTCRTDPCEGMSCGANSYCSRGACSCNEGFEDPDNDDVCTKQCPANQHDPDGDGVCTSVCSYDKTDAVAKPSLLSIPPEPFERGEGYECKNNVVAVVGKVIGTEDACEVAHTSLSNPNVEATGHSHPYFEWDPNRDYIENPIRCGKDLLFTPNHLTAKNGVNRWHTDVDRANARCRGMPSYLVTPARDVVKVHRLRENCSVCGDWDWVVEQL